MEHKQIFGYNPKVTLYEYNKQSSTRFWMNYALPNGRRVRRPCDNNRKEAGRKVRIKQAQLMNGGFDIYDRKKLGRFLTSEQRLTLEEARSLYLEITINNKTRSNLKRDEYLLNKAFDFFSKRGLTYLDDISPLDCVRLISSVKARGLKRSSIKNYWMAVSKVFNKLRKMKLIRLENPMMDVDLPKEGKLHRDRIPSVEEVQAILSNLGAPSVRSPFVSPAADIIRFTLFTGARIGEVLHAEWDDFDLEAGYWYLRDKPDCPGVEGLGWSPKWGKERAVKLFPEAISILKRMPKRKTVGFIRDELGNQIAIPANFVFPKMQVKSTSACRMHVKLGHHQCSKCNEFLDISACEHRVVVYSRCNSIRKAWHTILKKAGVEDLVIHDFRRFFNRVILQEKLGFSPEESGRYIGNSEEVNREHYSPISAEIFERKIKQKRLGDLIGNLGGKPEKKSVRSVFRQSA